MDTVDLETLRRVLKRRLLLEQMAPGFLPVEEVAICAWCGELGGGKGEALDMHEWLIKRNGNINDALCFTEINCVLVHHDCHHQHGQTKEFTRRCWSYKERLGYNPEAWLNVLQANGLIKTVTDYLERRHSL